MAGQEAMIRALNIIRESFRETVWLYFRPLRVVWRWVTQAIMAIRIGWIIPMVQMRMMRRMRMGGLRFDLPMPSEAPQTGRPGRDRDTFMAFTRKHPVGSVLEGVINGVRHDLGVFVDFEDGMSGLIFRNKLPSNFETMRDTYAPGLPITVRIKFFNFDKLLIELDEGWS